jgi:putative oxidoreductase
MKKFFSINYSSGAFNFSMLLLRLCFGILLLTNHGIPKLMKFATLQGQFFNFLGMGSQLSLILVIFAEVFCSLFIILGLFTRLTVIPLIIMFVVILFMVNAGKPFMDSEMAVLYLAAFTTILFCGPGRISVDGMLRR